MPEFLKEFLDSLDSEQAIELGQYLRENSNAYEEIEETLWDSHPELTSLGFHND